MLLAYMMIQAVVLSGPILGSADLALLLPLFVIIFLIVALGEVVHPLFNNYTFCYFTAALITGAEQAPLPCLISLFIGGGFLVLMAIQLVKAVMKKVHSAGA
ncbi:MAG TPA: hypothetical protein VEF53_06560 [Patescibacteria group bacterium]|nr:hypothetical protein [Patescibacteria group bacterium]